MCTGTARSQDAIIFVVQKKHSTYDQSHDSFGFLSRAISSLGENYAHFNASDLLLWHEGDFEGADLRRLRIASGVNARLCLLDCCSGWGVPPTTTEIPYYLEPRKPQAPRPDAHWGREHWHPGYFYMTRFYSITMFPVLKELGYSHVMRMDDDSVVHSKIPYNVFTRMRMRGELYGWRSLATLSPRICEELRLLAQETPELAHLPAWSDHCAKRTMLAFYTNWFVSSVDLWLSARARALQRGLEASRLPFTNNLHDLTFQSVAVLTLVPPAQRRHFLDFTYEHVTIRNGSARVGGIESGYADPKGAERVRAFKRQWRKGRVRNCTAVETAGNGAEPRITYFVGLHNSPVCERDWVPDAASNAGGRGVLQLPALLTTA